MVEGFRRMQDLKGKGMTSEMSFVKVFPGVWKPSTFSDHKYVWLKTPERVMSAATSAGRVAGGEWGTLLAQYGKRKRGNAM
jgi:hypothetical protein